MFHYFSGSYATLSIEDGFLVEGSQNGYCSWSYNVYPAKANHYPITDKELVYMVSVGLINPNEERGAKCAFSRLIQGNWKTVNPPSSKSLLKLCEHYDTDYKLIRPGKSR